MSETFITQVVSLGRVTIPEKVREVLGIKEGMTVRVTVEKVEKTKP